MFCFALQLKRADVPLELEEIGLPMNTFGPKNPFIGEWRCGFTHEPTCCGCLWPQEPLHRWVVDWKNG